MKYRLEWNHVLFETNDWKEIESHSLFLVASIFERTPIGWCAT